MPSSPSTIRIYVESTDGERFEADVPIDTRISTLAADFFESLGWPTRDSHGRSQRAVVELVNTENPERTKRLRGDYTVESAGLWDGAIVRIFPESIAGCFLGEVPIIFADRSIKPIKAVEIGDVLLSMEPHTNKLVSTQVSQIFIGTANEYITLNGILHVTDSHPIWSNGKWVRASELTIGDTLQSVDGTAVNLYSIARHKTTVQVYNLHVVSNEHSFFAAGLLVHNMQQKSRFSSNLEFDTISSWLGKIDVLEDRVEELEFRLRKIAEAFELLGKYLQRVEFTRQRTVEQPSELKMAIAQVELDRSIDDFNEEEQRQLVHSIASKTGTPAEHIKILDLSLGSVLLTLELPEDAALELMRLYVNRSSFIVDLRIEKIELRPLVPMSPPSMKQLPPPRTSPIRILFLAANPTKTDRLRLDEEVREIDDALLQKAEFRNRFELVQQWAVRVTDLQQHLLRFQPDIVHFSGHGSTSSEIILEDASGNSKPISMQALQELFLVLKDNIRCVVLNACYSEPQAQAIAEHIDCVVGMSKAIGDTAAISFAKSFYQALGYGRSVDTAFKLGIGQIDLACLEEQNVPQLVAKHSNPKELIFV